MVRLELSSCRVHSRRGSGRGLYANVDQYSLRGRGHVTALDQWGPYDVQLLISYYSESAKLLISLPKVSRT